ncbi:MAG: rubrerythrin family protein [Patescibacteria group bacterium]
MSKTQENLLKAFIGESMARNKYIFFAKKAREEGYEGIAQIFEETADNERAHAERLLEFVKDKTQVIDTFVIDGPISTTTNNLQYAANGENYEWTKMYPQFEQEARTEGEERIASVFKEIGEVEEKHEERYQKLLKQTIEGKVFIREEEIEWKCLNCGYVHKGAQAPKVCPACGRPQNWYQPRGLNF